MKQEVGLYIQSMKEKIQYVMIWPKWLKLLFIFFPSFIFV